MSRRSINILLGTAALVLGCGIYVLFRSGSYVAGIFDRFRWILILREQLAPYACGFLKFWFPDFLWGLSFGCYLQAVHLPDIRGTWFLGGVSLIFGVLWELMQYVAFVPGTGDLLDILLYFLASILCILLNLKERAR